MSEVAGASGATKNATGYSGSPAPFAFFLIVFLVFLVFTALFFPDPASALFAFGAFAAVAFLPFTVSINKSGKKR